jgi:hypothetical protein
VVNQVLAWYLVVQTSRIARAPALFLEQLYLDFSWGLPTGRLCPVTALAAFPEKMLLLDRKSGTYFRCPKLNLDIY